MNKIKIIKNERDYKIALGRIEELIELDPVNGSEVADELELLALLINTYEDDKYKIEMPDPIDAIKFRMEQGGLTQKDLIPYFGSKSKVSEVLNRKRELTVKNIRALNTHLGIPAEVLLQDSKIKNIAMYSDIDFEKYPVLEMEKIGSFDGFNLKNIKDRSEEAIRFLFDQIGNLEQLKTVCYRKRELSRVNVNTNIYALHGWCLTVVAKASKMETNNKYDSRKLNKFFFRGLASLSTLKNGPFEAIEYLSNYGIKLIFIEHLKKTYLDGASFITDKGEPIIALTLRYNRVDYFWFTLFHELGHLKNDLTQGEFIADDMTLRGSDSDSEKELVADSFAEEHLLPNFSPENPENLSNDDIINYALKYNVHTAIVAGRIQYVTNNYRIFSNFVNKDKIKRPWE